MARFNEIESETFCSLLDITKRELDVMTDEEIYESYLKDLEYLFRCNKCERIFGVTNEVMEEALDGDSCDFECPHCGEGTILIMNIGTKNVVFSSLPH